MIRFASLAALAALGCASPSSAQSFDCRKASTPNEKLICANKPLSALDDSLAATVREAFTRSPERKARILAEERNWIVLRDKQCAATPGQDIDEQKVTAVGCLTGAYLERIQALRGGSGDAKVSGSAPAPAHDTPVAPTKKAQPDLDGQAELLEQAKKALLSPQMTSPPLPVTAEKVGGPVTGQLPDKIKLTIENSGVAVLGVSDKSALSVSFCTEVTSMENVWSAGKVVQQPVTRCRTPDRKLHLAGRRQLTGVHMTPEVDGLWRWDNDYRLTFRPKKFWPTAQTYQVQFDQSIFPEAIELANTSMHFATQPLSAHVTEMEFLQDPNDVENRGVSTVLDFNAPVDAQTVRDHLRFTLEELTDGAKPTDRKIVAKSENLPFDVQFDQSGAKATVTTPIKTLPDKERFVKVAVLPGITASAGGQPLAAAKPGELEQRVRIPSKFEYATFEKIEMRIVKDDHYVPGQVLIVKSNVPVSVDELAQKIEIYLLPADKQPLTKEEKPVKDYAWTSASEVTDGVLAKASPIHFSVSAAVEPYATLHSIRLDVDPGRWVYVKVGKGLSAKGGYVLSADHVDTVLAPGYSKEVQILSDGALLSLSGDKKISVYSLGAQKLRFQVERVMNDAIAHLVSQTRGNFADPSFSNRHFSAHNIAEHFSDDVELPSVDLRKPQFSGFDFAPYLTRQAGETAGRANGEARGRGLFFLSVQAIDKDAKGEESVVSTDNRFVLVSDLGLVVKTSSEGAHDVFVQSVRTGEPVAGAKVEVLGLNGLAVAVAETGGDGHAIVPSLQGLGNDKQPVAYVVKKGDDLAFMSYQERDRKLDYSRFDTEGLAGSEDDLRAFLFSDRGIYRPGEEGHVGMVVKQGNWTKSLADAPLQMEVTNPRGQVVDKAVVKLDAEGLAEYRFATQETSPTGVYNLRLSIASERDGGAQIGSTSVRVEEFLPDTLKITSEFNRPSPKGWLSPEGLKATVALQHLYGAPAVDHRIKASLSVTPGSFSFKEFADYQFFDPLKAPKSFDQPIGDAQTDNDGKAMFDLKLGQFGASTYRLSFLAEGFAQDSGRSVRSASSVLVSSRSYVVGIKTEGNLGYVNKDEKRQLQLIAVNSDLAPVEAPNLKFNVARIDYISSLIKNEGGAYEYRSVPKETIVSSGALPISAKGTATTLDSAKAGDYALILLDERGATLQRVAYTIVGEGSMLGHARKDATISVKLDKKKYEPEETITLNIVSPYTGAGLITLETDKVLAFKWFKSATTSSVQTIAIPKGFNGKGFVNVQFVRSLQSRDIYTAPLAYDVEPFFVSTDAVDSQIALTVPEKAKPGDSLTIGYKTRAPGKIIIYAVDEGILQYAHYQTPDPLGYFVNRRGLHVATSQILDLLMPEYSIMQSLSQTGGDGEDEARKSAPDGKNLNPFKRKTLPPVVFWSGIIDSDTTLREIRYPIPDHFNGKLRVMAVSVSDKTIGAAEGKALAQGDIIISPNAPTFAAPGDEFVVGLSVANNIQGSGKNARIKLTVAPSEHLDVVEGAESELAVAEGSETKSLVRVRARDVLGGATLKFVATSGRASASIEQTLSVRPPLPSMTALLSGYAGKGEQQVKQDRDLYPEFAAVNASVSTLPVSLIPGLAQYLDRYPYGCTEQTVSKAFPAVILYGQKDLGGDAAVVQASVTHAMQRLRELQNSKGGFGYWWYGGEANDFVSVYALHYMLLAKEKHLPAPEETFRLAQDYVKTMVNRSPSSLEEARNEAYGIYVLTRSGVVTANYLPNLLRYLNDEHKNEWKNDLTAVYIAAAYKLMQLAPEASQLMNEFTLGDPAYWQAHGQYFRDSSFYNSVNRYAQYLAIVSDHFPEQLPNLDRNILFRIANFIGEGGYNTLSSSYAIMAFSAYGQASTRQTEAHLAISQQDDQGGWKPLALTGEQVKRAQPMLTRGDVAFSGGGAYGLFYQLATDGYDRIRPTQPIEDGLEISRQYLDAAHQPVREVKLGDTIEVVVTMRAHDNKTLANMALVELLPSGFETVPESIARPSATAESPGDNSADQGTPGGDDEQQAREQADVGDFDGQPWTPEAVDVREDRVIAFGEVPASDVVYRYKIKAVNAGVFTTPPAYVESMYERAIKARGIAGTLTVR